MNRAIFLVTAIVFGCESATPTTQRLTDPEQQPRKPVVVVPSKKIEPPKNPNPPKKEEPKEDSKEDPPTPRPPTFEEALAELKKVADEKRREGEELAGRKKRLFTDKEADILRFYLRVKPGEDNYMAMSQEDDLFMAKAGLGDLATAIRCQWALADPLFTKAAKWVWDRSPKVRSMTGLSRLASRWGFQNSIERGTTYQILEKVEAGRTDESLRKEIINFAGEEYYINRP